MNFKVLNLTKLGCQGTEVILRLKITGEMSSGAPEIRIVTIKIHFTKTHLCATKNNIYFY